MTPNQQKALADAEATFRRYGIHHQAKGTHFKALENFELADQMLDALILPDQDQQPCTGHKLNHTASVAVSTERHWQWITPDTPRGVTLHLLTIHGVDVKGILTAYNLHHFRGWESLARIPPGIIT